jgi:hypothetical protein
MKEDQLSADQIAELRGFQADLKSHLKAKRYDEGMSLAEKAEKMA